MQISDEVKQWIAKQFALKFQHNYSQEAFDDQCHLWRDPTNPFTTQEAREALPKSFSQALTWLQQSSGYPLVAYDRCPRCSVMVYRCEFKDHSQCPRCSAPRYKEGSRGKVPCARLLYNPIGAYVDNLWGEPAIAKYAFLCKIRGPVGPVIVGTKLSAIFSFWNMHMMGSRYSQQAASISVALAE